MKKTHERPTPKIIEGTKPLRKQHPRLLMIDNYDSFTYNLVQYLAELGAQVEVHRNDKITLKDIARINPDAIVISPGPCSPKEAGISVEVIRAFFHEIPVLGVCLGHQSIGYAFGGKIVKADRIMHGKTSEVFHEGKGIFEGLPSPFIATRYHSLVIEPGSVPPGIVVTASTDQGEIMAVAHSSYPLFGIQFHPESIMTEHGYRILFNFLAAI